MPLDSIDDLLRRMSLAEKVGQLNHPGAQGPTTTGAGAGAAADTIEERIRRGEVGCLGTASPERLRAFQRIAVEESPSGIPLLFSIDVIHGHRTIFPLPVALACSWDPGLVRRTARTAAAEAAGEGITLAWAPMLDISRDARWGRSAEGFGEDPVLAAAFARAVVAGFQEGSSGAADMVLATAKHFAGYGFSEGGRDYNGVDASPYRMHNVVLPPFKAAVEAGVGCVMVGFHDLAGIPCTAHRELLRDLLRGLWGFEGMVVSDYTAIMELVNHGVAADLKEAAFLAFTAGVDVDLVSGAYIRHLPGLVAEGRIGESDIDAACRRVLAAKQRIGLFDDPYRGIPASLPTTLPAANRRLARDAAVASCVLLKNDGVLPLPRRGTVALVGPLADSRANMQGTWAVAARPADSITVLEGMQGAAAGTVRILHAKGANIVDEPDVAARLNVFGETATIDPRSPAAMTAEAMDVAAQADVVVACVGEAKEHAGESSTRTDIRLPRSQRRLLKALRGTGKPLVVVTMSGRPLALEWEHRNAGAILHAWFPGSEAGNAVAALLFGDESPSGRLAMSFPRDSGQCPIHYAEPPTGRPLDRIGVDVAGDTEVSDDGQRVFRKFTTACRIEGPHTPLYPFGHGLGYTTFDYGDLAADKRELDGADDVLGVEMAVRNTGTRAGQTVVQLFIGDPVASRSRPVREMKKFRKLDLAPGESGTVRFEITADDLSFVRADRLAAPETVWEPGTFLIHAGPDSQSLSTVAVEWRNGPA